MRTVLFAAGIGILLSGAARADSLKEELLESGIYVEQLPSPAAARQMILNYAAIQKSCGEAVRMELGTQHIFEARYGDAQEKKKADAIFAECVFTRAADDPLFDRASLLIPKTWQ